MKLCVRSIFAVLLLAGMTLHAQNTDSLKKELGGVAPKAKVHILYVLGKCYYDLNQFDTSVAYFKRAIATAKREGYDSMHMEASGFLSAVLREAGRNAESLLYCDTTLQYTQRMQLPMRQEDFLVEKGSTLIMMKRFSDFGPVMREALNIAEANRNKKEEARIYWVTSIYYDALDNYALQVDYLNRAIVIYDSLKMYPRIAD